MLSPSICLSGLSRRQKEKKCRHIMDTVLLFLGEWTLHTDLKVTPLPSTPSQTTSVALGCSILQHIVDLVIWLFPLWVSVLNKLICFHSAEKKRVEPKALNLKKNKKQPHFSSNHPSILSKRHSHTSPACPLQPPHPPPPTQTQDLPHGHWWKRPSSRNQMSWKDIKQPGCPMLASPQPGRRLGLAHPPQLPSSKPPQLHSVGPWRGRLMKHGQGITLTLTGRCPVLSYTTINNMAATGILASEKEGNWESDVFTDSCSGLTFF